MPKFSIVVPIYNMEAYLERCIRSILNQTLQNFELILVDDGSSDCCPEICKRFVMMDGRITVIQKENRGVAQARQDGACAAVGVPQGITVRQSNRQFFAAPSGAVS